MTIKDVCNGLNGDTMVYIHSWYEGDGSEVKRKFLAKDVSDDLKNVSVAFVLDGQKGVSIFVKKEDIEDIMDGKVTKCCICGFEFVGWGNNPWPIVNDEDARCCDMCNFKRVVPSRIILANHKKLNVKKEG